MNEKDVEVFDLTAENLDYFAKLLNGPRSPIMEDVCGEVLDAIEELRAGRDWPISDKLPAFDRELDKARWEPEEETG